ncbi:2TM domain-containing protein [Salinibacter ruber]|uniref:2TM domain-containing protein n=1 Tax=Salinibacter ruber TaxID=146919 RepID=UPI00216918E3|nr:2TM domain-containing protein [Salinibacter ruber]MCS4171030.1 putative transcriptional regulator [Salinibacter ruber]
MCSSTTLSVQPTCENQDTRSVEKETDRHVRQLVAFYVHFVAFLAVNAMLVGINLATSPSVFWAIWPISG